MIKKAYILNIKMRSFGGIGMSIFKKIFKRQLRGVVRCESCGARNWADDDYCENCGEYLD